MSTERHDLLETLDKHRGFLRYTAQGLTDKEAALTSTVSVLSVGGTIKHVTATESAWADFIVNGPSALGSDDNFDYEQRLADFEMRDGDTLAGLLERYEEVAARTDVLVATVDLDAGHSLPKAPWFEPGATWSARRALLHIIAETSQHAGHADIVREAIDGQKTMG